MKVWDCLDLLIVNKSMLTRFAWILMLFMWFDPNSESCHYRSHNCFESYQICTRFAFCLWCAQILHLQVASFIQVVSLATQFQKPTLFFLFQILLWRWRECVKPFDLPMLRSITLFLCPHTLPSSLLLWFVGVLLCFEFTNVLCMYRLCVIQCIICVDYYSI